MYHDVLPEAPGISGGSEHFAVSREAFGTQLDQIGTAGLTGCSIAQAIDGPSAPFVGISFDDGDAGQYHHAFPELATRNMTATFFITTDWVGQPGYVTWDQLREMRSAGMSIQSHTRTHPFLSGLDADGLRHELAGAKTELDSQLRQDTTMLAFPGGDAPDRRLRHLVAEAGYTVVGTSRWGSNRTEGNHRGASPHYIRRCTIRGTPSPEYFSRVLRRDPRLTLQRYVRETTLGSLRSMLGRQRYARWRAGLLGKLRS